MTEIKANAEEENKTIFPEALLSMDELAPGSEPSSTFPNQVQVQTLHYLS